MTEKKRKGYGKKRLIHLLLQDLERGRDKDHIKNDRGLTKSKISKVDRGVVQRNKCYVKMENISRVSTGIYRTRLQVQR